MITVEPIPQALVVRFQAQNLFEALDGLFLLVVLVIKKAQLVPGVLVLRVLGDGGLVFLYILGGRAVGRRQGGLSLRREAKKQLQILAIRPHVGGGRGDGSLRRGKD